MSGKSFPLVIFTPSVQQDRSKITTRGSKSQIQAGEGRSSPKGSVHYCKKHQRKAEKGRCPQWSIVPETSKLQQLTWRGLPVGAELFHTVFWLSPSKSCTNFWFCFCFVPFKTFVLGKTKSQTKTWTPVDTGPPSSRKVGIALTVPCYILLMWPLDTAHKVRHGQR